MSGGGGMNWCQPLPLPPVAQPRLRFPFTVHHDANGHTNVDGHPNDHADVHAHADANGTSTLTLVMEEQRGRNVAVAHSIAYVTIQVLPLQGFISGQLSFDECDDLPARIGRAMRTDQAILTVLQTAASEIQRLRSAPGGRSS
jgi:hypothetical protein